MSDKKYTPREAAIAVLKKAEELYKASELAKGDWAKIHSKLKREGYSEESADKIDGAIKAKMGKSEENPDEKADADLGEKVEQEVEQHEAENDAPEHKMKGHIKLAKFMGRMEHKKGQKAKEMDKAETGHEKGVNKPIGGEGSGMSLAGAHTHAARVEAKGPFTNPATLKQNVEGARNSHKKVLGEMKNIKPKLPG